MSPSFVIYHAPGEFRQCSVDVCNRTSKPSSVWLDGEVGRSEAGSAGLGLASLTSD